MKATSPMAEFSSHALGDIGGILGLLLDLAFLALVIVSALLMMVVATILLGIDRLVSPILGSISRWHKDAGVIDG